MQFTTDYRTESYALNTGWNDFPEDVKERAIMCAIDLMTALILGSYGKQYRAGQQMLDLLGLCGDVPYIGSKKTSNIVGAAVSMGHASNSFDIDDGHKAICGHPGTSFVGGVLAAALDRDITYRQYLETLVVCYELSIRWAQAMQHHYGYLHSTGAYGAFGTAVGMGRILGFSKEQLNNALSVADYHAPMTPVMRAVEYPSMNKDGVPFGVWCGALAIMETIAGTTGKTHLLEMPEYMEHLNSLGKRYCIRELYFKPYTACRWTHQPILACQTLMKKHLFCSKDVESVIVYTFEAAARLSKIEPHTTDEAQYNIAFPVASAIVYGDVGYAQVRDEALDNLDVRDIMKKLSFVVDPELDKLFPGKRLARVEIKLKDGRLLISDSFEAAGEPDDPTLGLKWISDKFIRITSTMLSRSAQENILSMMTGDLDIPVRKIVDYINSHRAESV